MKNVRAVIAEYERERISEQITRGRRLKVKSGSVLMHARVPYGYRVVEVDGKWELEIHLTGDVPKEMLTERRARLGNTMLDVRAILTIEDGQKVVHARCPVGSGTMPIRQWGLWQGGNGLAYCVDHT